MSKKTTAIAPVQNIWRAADSLNIIEHDEGFLITENGDINQPIAFVSVDHSGEGTWDNGFEMAECVRDDPSCAARVGNTGIHVKDLRIYSVSTVPMPGWVFALACYPCDEKGNQIGQIASYPSPWANPKREGAPPPVVDVGDDDEASERNVMLDQPMPGLWVCYHDTPDNSVSGSISYLITDPAHPIESGPVGLIAMVVSGLDHAADNAEADGAVLLALEILENPARAFSVAHFGHGGAQAIDLRRFGRVDSTEPMPAWAYSLSCNQSTRSGEPVDGSKIHYPAPWCRFMEDRMRESRDALAREQADRLTVRAA